MIILGIETSCDETSASIVKEGKNGQCEILSNIVHSQISEHADYGGVVPDRRNMDKPRSSYVSYYTSI